MKNPFLVLIYFNFLLLNIISTISYLSLKVISLYEYSSLFNLEKKTIAYSKIVSFKCNRYHSKFYSHQIYCFVSGFYFLNKIFIFSYGLRNVGFKVKIEFDTSDKLLLFYFTFPPKFQSLEHNLF